MKQFVRIKFFLRTKKQLKVLQKKINGGQLNFDKDDPMDLFLASNVVRYCHYNETQRVLGQTYGMCILQVNII